VVRASLLQDGGWSPFGCVSRNYSSPHYVCGLRPRAFVRNTALHGYLTSHEQNPAAANATGFRSPTSPLGTWVDQFNFSSRVRHQLNAPNWPICLAGSFFASRRVLMTLAQEEWAALHHSLTVRQRDSLEEGHFMERIWAVLLAPRLDAADMLTMLAQCGAWKVQTIREQLAAMERRGHLAMAPCARRHRC